MFGLSDMVSSGINFVGGLMQQNSNAKMAASQRQSDERGAERAMIFSDEQAARQMAFQERMANTAHQREVSDLRAAGLNPILSGTGGMGSATPSGATGTSAKASAQMQAPAPNVLGDAVNTAMAAKRIKAEVANMEKMNEQIDADTHLKKQDSVLRSYQMDATKAQERLTNQETQHSHWNTQGAEHQASILSSNAKGRALEGQIDETKYGEIMRYIDRAIDSLGRGASAFGNVFRRPHETIHRRGPPLPRR